MEFIKLFEPAKIRNMEVKNRIIMPAMHLGFCEKGFITERFIEFYRMRARGEVGTIIIGGCAVDEYAGGLPNFVFISDDKYIPGLKKFTKTIHRFNTKVICQLYHAGRYAFSLVIGKQPISASALPSKFTGETPREMTKEEIEITINNICSAARRAKEAGFDGVELLGSAGYLINQFLSPLTNKREDEYGGSFENRLRFPLQLIKKVRETVGEDFPIFIRMSGDDFMPGSNTVEENKIIAKEYEKAGIDILNVTGGWHETRVPQISTFVPEGAFVYLAGYIKENVNIPVVACNRINDLFLAEKILRDNIADFVGMARAFIADPEILIKAKRREFLKIRKCIACNQGCFDSVFEVKPISCLVNPEAGREKFKIKKAKNKKNILIIGAGPAGCEAARILKIRGHRVEIFEKENEIGGQLKLASVLPERSQFKEIIKFYENQINFLKIKLNLNSEVNYSIVKERNPDVVIIATGATQKIPEIKGIDNKNVIYAFDILANKKVAGENVVIIGGGGVGIETALYLKRRNSLDEKDIFFIIKYNLLSCEKAISLVKNKRKVTIVEMLERIGRDIGKSTRWTFIQELKNCGIEIITSAKVQEIKENGVQLEDRFIPADTVVIATGTHSENTLKEELKDLNCKIYVIGDASSPRKAIDAIYEGYKIGCEI
jgi:2,4-dienoyl-CoA reductase (NADPH2)